MNAHTPSPDQVAEVSRLNRLRAFADRVAADRWRLERSDRGDRWIVASRFDDTEQVICDLTRYCRGDEAELLAGAIDVLTFFLPLFDRAARRTRDLIATVKRLESEIADLKGEAPSPDAAPAGDSPKDGKWPDYAAQVSMLLVDVLFQRFLSEIGGGEVVDDKDAADRVLKEQLGIGSKKQLNTEDAARAAWIDFRARFDVWKRGDMY